MQALWMLLASFFFSSMAVGIKFASTGYGMGELLFYRGLVSVVFMGAVMRSRGVPLASPVPWMHVWRNVIGVTSMSCWFYAIAHLPLATAMTLNYMSGVWIAAFVLGGALLYGKLDRQAPLMATLLASFAGVVLMLRPSLNQDQLFAGLIGLISGLCAALALMQVAALGRAGEPEARTVFYFSIGTTLAGLIGVGLQGFQDMRAIPWQTTAWLIPIGIFASLGQWSMTRAYSRSATLLVANLQYAGVIFAALFSLLLFGEQISWMSWLGIALIISSSIAATALRARALPNTPVDDR